MDKLCSKHGTVRYLTTENPQKFKENARLFLPNEIKVEKVSLSE
jgi:glutamate racemase